MERKNFEQMTVGGGCFWCTEAIFDQIKGVEKVVSGYSGGSVPGTPTYREVCSGLTGHAEVIQVTYDPAVVSFEDLLVIFMTSHDPTTLNRQGADRGTQYRSVIFYHNKNQKQIAEKVLNEMAPYYENPIVTELSPLQKFYPAEVNHQNYYANNPSQGYCTAVILPKLARLRQMHLNKLKQ
ncbi:peptide-methionine (S)-S-oxide reductase MsrA [Aequorivita todarodis]|uniref:peptide-methionine (S)-S-oxide reductase MsrA n=1 Tax=Aequorivita todarodis TaxID=2036821 RepID=UPI0023500612|nr:peptide-methionine (S)-S-oxide reductase MsrA [Aequorivita todarodis]MDC7999956.1 peptide-methionine (S)-S-oxide reductase MsrA [Aequorivita todarodis]